METSTETRFGEVLDRARGMGRAIGAFTCYDLLGFEAVVRAAESYLAPVVVLVSPSSFGSAGGERLVRAFVAAAKSSSVEVLVQLDHARDERLIERAADLRVDAVMADGSEHPFAENLAFTRDVAGSMRHRGVGVEAELGRVEGHEDEATETLSGAMTVPAEAGRFCEVSAVDCLAVAVGNVHGHYSGTPKLDWDRLEEMRRTVPVPLSLHGASGLPEADLARAVSLGAAKFNVNTELRAAYFGRLEEDLGSKSATLDLKSLGDGVVEAVQKVVEGKLSTFGWAREEA
ncbi:MAG TPA: class II fructose-bisphosphate aldolase [Rubrobacteraceae bacterium]|nr:class II fructose-bisphosphate aldolase [Rubrobacteraceae bacterium]